MKLSQREGTLLLATATVGLFGVSAILAGPKLDQWKDLRQEQAKVRAAIAEDQRWKAEGPRWQKEFQSLRKMLPPFPADQKMDVHWLSLLDDLARKDGVHILRTKGGEEKKVGDVYELPIECDDWEGKLDSLVHFLFDLQAEGAMLDIRQLLIKPKEAKTDDALRGRFTLYCAYTKESPAPKK
jgi:hypothetical protein